MVEGVRHLQIGSGRFGHHGFRGGAAQRAASGASAQAGVASATRDVSASLNIVTKEGDTVSISASFDAAVTYAGASARGTDGSTASAGSLQEQTQSSVSLQVQGSLNAQEQADIAGVVKRFLQDLGSIAAGHDTSIANVAGGDPTTLRSVAAAVSTQTTVTVGAADSAGTAVGAGRSAPAPMPMPATPVAGGDTSSTALAATAA